MGRWGFWAPLRDCSSPQKSMMKAHMLIGAVVMVGFTVGKGKWGRGREGGVAEVPGATSLSLHAKGSLN